MGFHTSFDHLVHGADFPEFLIVENSYTYIVHLYLFQGWTRPLRAVTRGGQLVLLSCIVRWIPPIAINGGGGNEVVHPVRRH